MEQLYVKFQADEYICIIEPFKSFKHDCIDGKNRYYLNDYEIGSRYAKLFERELEAAIINRNRFINLLAFGEDNNDV